MDFILAALGTGGLICIVWYAQVLEERHSKRKSIQKEE